MKPFHLLFLVLIQLFSLVFSWERKALQCWQCAAVPGYKTQCPNDAALYQLPEWNACMVWVLNRGNRVILQNFVYSHSDCTKEKLEHWSEYIQKTWREPGRAQCCFEDMCNNESLFQDTSPIIDDSVSIEAAVVDTKKIDCTQCLEIPHAFCMAEPDQDPNKIRMDFDDMIEKMIQDPENQVCNCAEGYIPIYDQGSLIRCHDPIIKTATIGGRCLRQEHCRGLTNSICDEDPIIKLPNGLPMKSCQCMDGYRDERYSCELDVRSFGEQDLEVEIVPTATIKTNFNACDKDTDCESIENAQCIEGKCQCLEGFLGTYDDGEPERLTWCKDPIVLTSTVGGYCLVPKHCAGLMGTTCVDKNPGEGGTFKRCECQDDLKPALPDPTTGVVKRCIGPNEEGVLSLISQALFGDNQPDSIPLKVNIKLTEKAILDACKSTMTVVELDEWIPSEQFKLEKDNITEALVGVVQAKLPNSALGHHGLIIRLMSEKENEKGNLMYTISMQRNRVMTIKKSFLDFQGERRENVQAEEVSQSYKWLNSNTYTGVWFLVKYGYIAIGILDEHNLNRPLMTWRDNMTPYDVGVAGVTSQGSATFYGVDCPVVNRASFYPDGACRDFLDCEDVPNTDCQREDRPDLMQNSTLRILTCRCADGFEPIPDPFRMLTNGCYDPIGRTVTVNARCLSDRHCTFLKNTECVPTYQNNEIKTCRCKKGTLPLARLKNTGLVPGCEQTEFAQLLTVDSCKRKFTLGAIKNWIPVTVMKTPFRQTEDVYSIAFYAKFNGAANPVNTTIAIKLLDAEKSPEKYYKVTISTTGLVSIYENIQGSQFLFGTFNREQLQVKDEVIDPSEFSPSMFQGFYVRYNVGDAKKGTISVGKIGEPTSLLEWTDTTATALNGTAYAGFEVEEGGNTEFGTVCFDVL